MRKITNIHPGEILNEEFLLPMNITAYRLAKETKISQTRISQIIKGQRSITVDTALRLAKFFGNSPEFWINLQNHHDLEESKQAIGNQLKQIKTLAIQHQF
jgi:addiction module HigA family antidote